MIPSTSNTPETSKLSLLSTLEETHPLKSSNDTLQAEITRIAAMRANYAVLFVFNTLAAIAVVVTFYKLHQFNVL